MVISAPGNTTCADTIKTVLSNTTAISPTVINLTPNCNMDTLKINTGTPNVTHSWSGTAAGNTITYPYTAATLTVYPEFTNSATGYYNYTDSMRTIPDGCLSITKYVASLKSFKGSLVLGEKLQCHNDSLGKIKASVLSEVNGPLSSPDIYTFTWSPASLTTTTATGVPCSSSKAPLKANLYSCTISNGNCVNTYTYNLINPPALREDSLYAYYCPKDSLALLVANPGNTDYKWHPDTLIDVSVTGDSAKVQTQNLHYYYVTYKHNGCADTARTILSVTTYDAFRPNELVNIFTPNGDKSNDFFYPFYQANLSQYQIFKQEQSYELKVYNRWGTLMYETTDYSKPWDGKTKSGSDADAGSYFFIVKYQSNCASVADVIEKKGFVELMR
jgi:gliding motility-associated-like protein